MIFQNKLLDWSAVAVTLGTIAQYLPAVAALFSIVWLGLQIWLFLKNKPWRKAK